VAHQIISVKADAESALIKRLRCGDPAALEELIARHYASVHQLVSRLTAWSADAEDLTQDVFVSAISAAARFRGSSSLATWLTRIAINACHSHHRKRLVRWAFWKREANAAEYLADDASQSAQQRERSARVKSAVGQLGGKYREVVVLHYLQQMAVEDVAKILAITRPAVEVRLHRARKMLGEMLADLAN
jgi:RNA polymerase sigma-70 factor (ECF subfamily)